MTETPEEKAARIAAWEAERARKVKIWTAEYEAKAIYAQVEESPREAEAKAKKAAREERSKRDFEAAHQTPAEKWRLADIARAEAITAAKVKEAYRNSPDGIAEAITAAKVKEAYRNSPDGIAEAIAEEAREAKAAAVAAAKAARIAEVIAEEEAYRNSPEGISASLAAIHEAEAKFEKAVIYEAEAKAEEVSAREAYACASSEDSRQRAIFTATLAINKRKSAEEITVRAACNITSITKEEAYRNTPEGIAKFAQIKIEKMDLEAKAIAEAIAHIARVKAFEEAKDKAARESLIARHRLKLKSLEIEYKGVSTPTRERSHRVAHCWSCKKELDNSIDVECVSCGWILCVCGACGCSR